MKKINNLKLLSLILVLILGCISIFPTSTFAYQEELSIDTLSTSSGKVCIEELQSFGLELPDAYKDSKLAEDAVKTIIDDLNFGSLNNGAIPYSYTELAKLAEEIRNIALKYDPQFAASYTLADSTVIGSWSDSYKNYNCYGYAIGKHVYKNPGYHSNNSFSMSLSIDQMADLVIKDLDKLGFWSYKTTSKPTSISSWEKVISIRKGSSDYHFMRGDTVNNWKHKPGATNPLTWKYTSPGHKNWTNEYSYKNVHYNGNTTYDSTVYYIRYWIKDGPGPQPSQIEITE